MKIVRVIGGLGNQMFQYALYLSLLEKGFDVKIDITQLLNYKLHNGYELEQIFNTKPNIADYKDVRRISRITNNFLAYRIKRKLLPPKPTEYIEKEYSIFDPQVFRCLHDTYFEGHWQNEKYFSDIRPKIIENFTFKLNVDNQNRNIIRQIKNSNSISIHVRRGDYVGHSYLSEICTAEYYKKAISTICNKIKDPEFFIFSDDIEWCKEQFGTAHTNFINWNTGKGSYIDMYLMSLCKHNIIANSSFSWWGAWLNINQSKIIICPKRWNTRDVKFDIAPENWITI